MTGSFLRKPNDTLACLRMETLSGGTYLSSPNLEEFPQVVTLPSKQMVKSINQLCNLSQQ